MDDREVVAAIVAGDPAGLAYAYDSYAASLYGYCRTMLRSPDEAADAVQDTFVVTAARVGELRDPNHLRPWLYAVARNECHSRLRSRPATAGGQADPGGPAEPGLSPQQAELRELVMAALWGLSPADREIIELNLRHELGGAELAAALGVSRNHANTMAARAHGRLEAALGALLVARTGRRSCPELSQILGDSDGRLTALARKRVTKHLGSCRICDERKQRALRPALLYGFAPLPAVPPWLRHQTLQLCADPAPDAREFKRHVLRDAGTFDADGFPRPPRSRRRFEPGPALITVASFAAAGIVVIALMALRGSPATLRPLGAASTTGSAAAAVATSGAGTPTPLVPIPTGTPSSAAASSQPSSSEVASAPPPSAKPSKSASPSASPSKSASPSPSPSPTPSPTPTVHIVNPTQPVTSPSPSPSPTPTTTDTTTAPPTTGT
jgi:RNA polymerase sigma factor (sigma-70 family)